MATHKVPQDVEADDKLIGFLSLKQFIFTVLGLGFGYFTFLFFTKVHPIAALIWIPPAIICFVLGLYQRKDQPVEVYLASALRFYIKPHIRKWSLEGYEERVIVTAPPKVEHNYTKNFTGEEATSHLTNLSRLMDSRGWATKLSSDWQNPQLATAAASDRLVQPGTLQTPGVNIQAYLQPVDVMDEQSSLVAQEFQSRINQTDSTAKQHAIQALQNARQAVNTNDDSTSQVADDDTNIVAPTYKQYPAMHQKIVSPAAREVVETEPTKVPNPPAAPQPISKEAPTPQTADDGSVEIKLH